MKHLRVDAADTPLVEMLSEENSESAASEVVAPNESSPPTLNWAKSMLHKSVAFLKSGGQLARVSAVSLLILGLGGTTFATWNAAQPMAAAVFNGGNLKLEAVGEPIWCLMASDTRGIVVDPRTYIATPGDTLLHLTQWKTAELNGDNMKAVVTVGAAAKSETDPGGVKFVGPLAEKLAPASQLATSSADSVQVFASGVTAGENDGDQCVISNPVVVGSGALGAQLIAEFVPTPFAPPDISEPNVGFTVAIKAQIGGSVSFADFDTQKTLDIDGLTVALKQVRVS